MGNRDREIGIPFAFDDLPGTHALSKAGKGMRQAILNHVEAIKRTVRQ